MSRGAEIRLRLHKVNPKASDVNETMREWETVKISKLDS